MSRREHTFDKNNITPVEYLDIYGDKSVATGLHLGPTINEVKMEFGINMRSFSGGGTSARMFAIAYEPTYTSDKSPIQIYCYNNARLYNQSSWKSVSVNTYYVVTTWTYDSYRSISLNGGSQNTSYYAPSSLKNTTKEIFLLNRPPLLTTLTSTGFDGQVYYWKIYINGILVRDYTMTTDGSNDYFYDNCGSISDTTGTSYYLVEQYQHA